MSKENYEGTDDLEPVINIGAVTYRRNDMALWSAFMEKYGSPIAITSHEEEGSSDE